MPTIFPKDSAQPAIPDFNTLLVRGPYPASAPIHLCLSHICERRLPTSTGIGAVLLSPSKRRFIQVLNESGDSWLMHNSGVGAVTGPARHVKILYPPTPLHLCLLLSMFHVADPSDDPAWNSKTTFTSPPTLIVLHELSFYLRATEDVNHNAPSSQPTLSSYLTLVTDALAAASFLSKRNSSTPPTSTRLALFESELDSLQLPILRVPQLSDFPAEESDDSEHALPIVPSALFVQKYFEYRLLFLSESREFLAAAGSAERQERDGTLKTLRLFRGDHLVQESTL